MPELNAVTKNSFKRTRITKEQLADSTPVFKTKNYTVYYEQYPGKLIDFYLVDNNNYQFGILETKQTRYKGDTVLEVLNVAIDRRYSSQGIGVKLYERISKVIPIKSGTSQSKGAIRMWANWVDKGLAYVYHNGKIKPFTSEEYLDCNQNVTAVLSP
jgi:GNAT superfamily N-acetyltransferase